MKRKVSLYRIFFKSELNITKHISIFLTRVQGDAAFSALIVNSYLYSHTRMRCCLFKLDLNSILSTWDISLKFFYLPYDIKKIFLKWHPNIQFSWFKLTRVKLISLSCFLFLGL